MGKRTTVSSYSLKEKHSEKYVVRTFKLRLAQRLRFPIARPDRTLRKGVLGVHCRDSGKADHESRLAHLRHGCFAGRPVCRHRSGCSHRRRLRGSVREIAVDVSGVGLAGKTTELDEALRSDAVIARQLDPIICGGRKFFCQRFAADAGRV